VLRVIIQPDRDRPFHPLRAYHNCKTALVKQLGCLVVGFLGHSPWRTLIEHLVAADIRQQGLKRLVWVPEG
jgi:hypothetical protein